LSDEVAPLPLARWLLVPTQDGSTNEFSGIAAVN
jgi:hypothetical protein